MKKYTDKARERQGSELHPDKKAHLALKEAEFSSRERETFFNEAYSDILYEYFEGWIKTAPHEVKTRELLYACVLGLGDVKSKLIQKETYGKNVPHMEADSNG